MELVPTQPSGSDVYGAKLYEHPTEANAEKLAYSAEASRMSTERSFTKMRKQLVTVFFKKDSCRLAKFVFD